MFRPTVTRSILNYIRNSPLAAHCDDGKIEESTPDLIEQANAKLEDERPKISTPPSYESFKNYVGNQTSVGAYDGFRMILQKQINLNCVVNHFYWIGSQLMGQPIYQYRIILPFDSGALINVATDPAMSNVEGEVRIPVSGNVSSKVNFTLGEQSQLSGDLEITDESSNTLLQFSRGRDPSLSLSYMQAVTPSITLGGTGTYSLKKSSLSTGYGASFSHGDHSLSAVYDNSFHLLYMKKVNPNRVHLMTDLQLTPDGNSHMTLSAEYTLKQSKVNMSIDSNLNVKSLVEAALGPGMQLQFAAEFNQPANLYRFGYGLVIG